MPLTFVSNSTDRVDCGSASNLDDMTALTAIAWIYPTLFSGRAIITKYRGTTPEGWTFELSANGTLTFVWETSGSPVRHSFISAAPVMQSNEWYCVAAVADITGAKLYIGSPSMPMVETTYSSQQVGGGSFKTDAARSVFIGARDVATPTGGFPGQIASAALFRRILPLDDIRRIGETMRNPGRTQAIRRTVGIAGLWFPGMNGATSVPDLSGNANHGTITGATVVGAPPPLSTSPVVDRRQVLADALAAITGTGAVTISAPALAGVGAPTVIGSGAITIGAPSISGTTSGGVTGSGGVTVAAPSLDAAGSPLIAGSGSMTIAHPAILGSASAATRAAASDAAYGGASTTDSEA